MQHAPSSGPVGLGRLSHAGAPLQAAVLSFYDAAMPRHRACNCLLLLFRGRALLSERPHDTTSIMHPRLPRAPRPPERSMPPPSFNLLVHRSGLWPVMWYKWPLPARPKGHLWGPSPYFLSPQLALAAEVNAESHAGAQDKPSAASDEPLTIPVIVFRQ